MCPTQLADFIYIQIQVDSQQEVHGIKYRMANPN